MHGGGVTGMLAHMRVRARMLYCQHTISCAILPAYDSYAILPAYYISRLHVYLDVARTHAAWNRLFHAAWNRLLHAAWNRL